MIDSTKLSGYPYSPTKMCDIPCKKQPICKKKRGQVKYVCRSYLKDECMVWLTRVISECGQGSSTDSQCIDQELHNLLYHIIRQYN